MTNAQQPISPGATDPRVEPVIDALIEHGHNGIDCYYAMSLDDTVEDVLAAADTADQAAGIVRVDIRDEELKDAVYDWITDGYAGDDESLRHNISLVFVALAALRGGR